MNTEENRKFAPSASETKHPVLEAKNLSVAQMKKKQVKRFNLYDDEFTINEKRSIRVKIPVTIFLK